MKSHQLLLLALLSTSLLASGAFADASPSDPAAVAVKCDFSKRIGDAPPREAVA